MDQKLDDIFTAAKWKELTPSLLYYAESRIRNCPWRGVPVTAASGGRLCVDGLGADDILQLAVQRFLSGQRTYDHSVSLDRNLTRAIRSIVWSANKSCRRAPLLEMPPDDQIADAADRFPGHDPAPDVAVMAAEQSAIEKRTLMEFEQTLTGDTELQRLVEAYKVGKFTPREVEEYTCIPAARVSELKRKLQQRMHAFEARAPHTENY